MVSLYEKKTGNNIHYFEAIVSLRTFEKKVNLGEDCFSLSLQSIHKIQVPTQKKGKKIAIGSDCETSNEVFDMFNYKWHKLKVFISQVSSSEMYPINFTCN